MAGIRRLMSGAITAMNANKRTRELTGRAPTNPSTARNAAPAPRRYGGLIGRALGRPRRYGGRMKRLLGG